MALETNVSSFAIAADQWLGNDVCGIPAIAYEALTLRIRSALVSRREDAFMLVCDEAIRHSLPPEQLVIMVKREWRAMPGSLGLVRMDAEHALTRHVTRCIKEYFHPRRFGNSAESVAHA